MTSIGAAMRALATSLALAGGEAVPGSPPGTSVLAASDGKDDVWFVIRKGALSAELGHLAVSMPAGTYQRGLPLEAAPIGIAASGDRAILLFAPRSALVPRPYLLSTSARPNPVTGAWVSIPPDRLELLRALPIDGAVESMASGTDGLRMLFEGDARLWQLVREEWRSLDLPEPLRTAAQRRLEPIGSGASILATTGSDGAWERWRGEETTWTRHALGLAAALDVEPIGSAALLALVTERMPDQAIARRVVSLEGDRPKEIVALGAEIPEGTALAWLGGAPVLIDGASGAPRLRRVDVSAGVIEPAVTLEPQRTLATAWTHLPILGAVVISLLMVVFFVRSLRDESAQRMPEGWEPMPLALRIPALVIDLVPGIVAAKFVLGVPWSAFLTPPWLIVDADAALPSIVAPIVTVVICAVSESLFATSLGKRIFGGRVVSMRGSAASIDPTIVQTIGRNVFKAVILQVQILAIFTLMHPLGQGVGETVSATAVVRRRAPQPEMATL